MREIGELRGISKLDESGHLKTEITRSQIGLKTAGSNPSILTSCNFGFEMPGFVQFRNSPLNSQYQNFFPFPKILARKLAPHVSWIVAKTKGISSTIKGLDFVLIMACAPAAKPARR